MAEQEPQSTSTDPWFYFGAMSPYSWFAAERIGGLLPDAVWRPVYAGALFKASGRSTWGLGPEGAEPPIVGNGACSNGPVRPRSGPSIPASPRAGQSLRR